MTFFRRRHLTGLLLGAIICMLAGLAPGRDDAQTGGPPSPEELVLSLIPYQLTQADLPTGFLLGPSIATSPASRAWDLSNTATEGHDQLRRLQSSGFLAGIRQSVTPTPVKPVQFVDFTIEAFSGDTQASTALRAALKPVQDTGVQTDTPALTASFGDESGALHVVLTQDDNTTTGLEIVTWRRGQLLFAISLNIDDTSETIDQTLPFVQAADRHVAAVAPPALPQTASLPVAGNEQYRVDAMYALYPRLPTTDQAPYGFFGAGRSILNNGDLLLQGANSAANATRLSRFKRIVGVQRIYATAQGSAGNMYHISYALSVDPTGAQAMVADGDQRPGSARDTLALPVQLADGGKLYHETFTADSGLPREIWRASWSQGRVAISVWSDARLGDINSQAVVDLAVITDARYNRGALPAILTGPGPSAQQDGS